MALSGLQVYKLLPKTNCKDCGTATCMAFAMQLAAGKTSADKCPHLSPEVAAGLREATAPPVRTVTVGTGERAVTVGGETVMFRHERRFEHAPAFAVLLDDSLSDQAFTDAIAEFESQCFERVGETLRLQMLAVASAEVERLRSRAAQAAATGAPVMVMSEEAAALRAAPPPSQSSVRCCMQPGLRLWMNLRPLLATLTSLWW